MFSHPKIARVDGHGVQSCHWSGELRPRAGGHFGDLRQVTMRHRRLSRDARTGPQEGQRAQHGQIPQRRPTRAHHTIPSSKEPRAEPIPAGSTKPPPASTRRDGATKDLKARLQRASDPPDHRGRRERRSGVKLAESRPGQRERERERRVSDADADASYYGPAGATQTLSDAIPRRNHAKHNSLSEATRSLSQGPRQTISCRPRRPTQNPTLCFVNARCRTITWVPYTMALPKVNPLWSVSFIAPGEGG